MSPEVFQREPVLVQFDGGLKMSQIAAVREALLCYQRGGLSLIQGPPGTGKTKTIGGPCVRHDKRYGQHCTTLLRSYVPFSSLNLLIAGSAQSLEAHVDESTQDVSLPHKLQIVAKAALRSSTIFLRPTDAAGREPGAGAEFSKAAATFFESVERVIGKVDELPRDLDAVKRLAAAYHRVELTPSLFRNACREACTSLPKLFALDSNGRFFSDTEDRKKAATALSEFFTSKAIATFSARCKYHFR
ncbi:hypothetical protein DFJ73DRAFT_92200 [Zopfochytrium polystomum]|nr:hypothetical protein DFJ73DRAFT_92200 [Zopfochytrium polystomum]